MTNDEPILITKLTKGISFLGYFLLKQKPNLAKLKILIKTDLKKQIITPLIHQTILYLKVLPSKKKVLNYLKSNNYCTGKNYHPIAKRM